MTSSSPAAVVESTSATLEDKAKLLELQQQQQQEQQPQQQKGQETGTQQVPPVTNTTTLSKKLLLSSSHGGVGGTSNHAANNNNNGSEERLNEIQVKHREEMYWLQLELDTTRREKEAVEDRMAELYRDMQDLIALSSPSTTAAAGTATSPGSIPAAAAENGTSPRKNALIKQRSERHTGGGLPITAHHVLDLEKQLEKREKMIRIMNNQIALVRSSSDHVIKSLKDEISDLMDEKSRVEVNLMNQLTNLDREKRELQRRVEIAEQKQRHTPSSSIRASSQHVPRTSSALKQQQQQQQQNQQKDRIGQQQQQRTPSNSSHAKLSGGSAVSARKNVNAGKMSTCSDHVSSAVTTSSSPLHSSNSATSTATTTVSVANAAKMATELKQLKADLAKYRSDLFVQCKALSHEKWQVEKLKETNEELNGEIARLEKELLVVRSSAEAVQIMDRIQQNRSDTMSSLERVAYLWDRADQTIQSLDGIMAELRPNSVSVLQGAESSLHDNRDQMLSTLETACLIHGQVKVALVLIELKLRNNMACFLNDKAHLDVGAAAAMGISSPPAAAGGPTTNASSPLYDPTHNFSDTSPYPTTTTTQQEEMTTSADHPNDLSSSAPLSQLSSSYHNYYDASLNAIQEETMAAIQQVEEVMNQQLAKLQEQSAQETEIVKLTLESKVEDLERMQSRQSVLEQELSRMHETQIGLSKEEINEDTGEVDLYVSREVLEQLQNEVLQVVERLQEKNELVGRLTANVEEHKVRERALMDELRRLLKEQAEAQEIERQRRIDAQKALDPAGFEEDDGGEDDVSGEPGEDGSYLCESDEEFEDEDFEEETVYDD